MEQRKDVTVPMEAESVREIEDQLTYGDSRSEWIREAIRMRLDNQNEVQVEMGEDLREQIRLHVLNSDKSVQKFMEEAVTSRLNEDT